MSIPLFDFVSFNNLSTKCNQNIIINIEAKLAKRLNIKAIRVLFRKYSRLKYKPILQTKTHKLINPNRILIPDFLFLSQTIRPKEKATKEVNNEAYPAI
jgi:hypothetical protein